MPNKRKAIGSPSRAMGKKRRTASRTGGQRVKNERRTVLAGKELPRKHKMSNTSWQKDRRKLLISHQVKSRRRMHGHSHLLGTTRYTKTLKLQIIPLHEFTPSQESSIHDTVREHVPSKIKEKIWEGKFIELHSLLRTQKEMEEVDEGDLKFKRFLH
ncbi:unnamed protein product [Mytilus edulis]|uniref:Uncharacterized protein n=1 Tax=Mytilus edulis TaxID=6550 RepID=A0A8S3RJW6_MYTED|nr:unnamed protein product [Mytilus edulis]